MSSRFGVLAILSMALFAVPLSPSAGQQTGRITGTVVADSTGAPLAFANVLLKNTPRGTFVKGNGTFVLEDVPVGSYSVLASMMGYATGIQDNVVVAAGATVALEFRLQTKVVIQVEPTVVIAPRPPVDGERTHTVRPIIPKELENRSVNTLEEALVYVPGITLEEGEIHIRGGRAWEVRPYADGMPIGDIFVGRTGLSVGLVSLADIEVLTGGFDAEYGNVQSGVINLRTKEGTSRYRGTLKFMTDDYGAPDKTYFNYDNLAIGYGGPLFDRNLRFFISGEATFSDTHLKTLEPRQQKQIWGLIEFRDRQTNSYSGQAKLTYFFAPTRKLAVELLASGEKSDRYHHAYSRVGYWSRARNHWWFEPLDETYSRYVGPSHTPDVTDQHRSVKLVWNHNAGPSVAYSLRLGRFTAVHQEAVLGKEPWQYESLNSRERIDPENGYFVVQGDYPHWQCYSTRMWTCKGDMTIQKSRTHQVKFGVETNLYRVRMEDMYFPSLESPRGVYTDIYEFDSWGMAAFIQDKMVFEGMNVRAGLRLDAFDPGRDAVEAHNSFLAMTGFWPEPADLLSRIEWQVSPRLGISYPISTRNALYFNYGRFYQMPRLQVLYQFLGETGAGLIEFGNPRIDAESTIMYEVGIQHQFTGTVAGDIAMFYKDIYGLTGTGPAPIVDGSSFQTLFGPTAAPVTYMNRDYASVRGIEVKITKRFSHHSSGSFTYTFSKATGSSSNELQGSSIVTGALDRAPITELPLNWDRNHVLSANLYVSQPGVWGCNLDWSYSTGVPFTPMMPREREARAALINSGRLPARSTVNIKANKRYRIAGSEVSLFLEGRNVLDRRNIATLSPGGWPGGNGNYIPYYTSEDQLGGAYDRGELMGLPEVSYVPLNDPRVYGAPRNFRVGLSFDW